MSLSVYEVKIRDLQGGRRREWRVDNTYLSWIKGMFVDFTIVKREDGRYVLRAKGRKTQRYFEQVLEIDPCTVDQAERLERRELISRAVLGAQPILEFIARMQGEPSDASKKYSAEEADGSL